ncbi:replication initiation protein [Rhizobium leguminosarum]|jgi:hypothetical protein|uniref:replication initiation protein n=1 Tax=Rhizobium leguminosarum TaxID=384 RepID=UPI002E0D7B8A|nr:replication initiation protein [Rhizobium leguminosarum]
MSTDWNPGKGLDYVKKGSSVIAAIAHEQFPFAPVDLHIFTYLLARFFYDIAPGVTHSLPVKELLTYSRLDRRSKLMESLRRLSQGMIEVDYKQPVPGSDLTEQRTMFCHYLSADISHSDDGMMTFAFDPLIIPFIANPKVYGLIDKRVHHALKSIPAIRLYETMTSNFRLKTPEWTATVEELRAMMQVGDKHARFDNFRRHVLEKAISDVNAVAEFDVEIVELVTGGKGGQVQQVVFRANPKSHTRILEASSVRSVGTTSRRKGDMHTVDLLDGMTNSERGRPAEVSSAGIEAAREVMADDADLNQLLQEWRQLNRGRTFNDPDQAFVEWVVMTVERENDPFLKNINDDVFGQLLARS